MASESGTITIGVAHFRSMVKSSGRMIKSLERAKVLREAIAPLVEAMNQSDLGNKKKLVLVGLNTADLKAIKKAYEGA